MKYAEGQKIQANLLFASKTPTSLLAICLQKIVASQMLIRGP